MTSEVIARAVRRCIRQRMGFIATHDGTKLFYRDWGTGPNVMVFVAGQALPCDIWNYNLPFFVECGVRCIAFDRRGHGRSDQPGSGCDIDTLARDIGAILECKELRDVTVVARSLGASETTRYLARHDRAKRIARAVLVGTAAPQLDPAAAAPVAAEWQRDFAAWVAANKRAFFTPHTSPELVDWGARLMEQIPLYVILQTLKAMASLDLREDLRAIETPTLVIHGALDASIPIALGEATAALLGNARFVRYADAAHCVFITHAPQVHRDIVEHVAASG